jgi:hypothetical protein
MGNMNNDVEKIFLKDVEKIFLKDVEKHTNINDFTSAGLLDDENEIKSIIDEILVELRKQK